MELQNVDTLFKMRTQMRDVTSQICRSEGITGSEAMVLMRLYERDGCSVKELVLDGGFNQGNTSLLCKRIESVGLIVRKRSTDDERVSLLSLSEEGKALTERLNAKFIRLDNCIASECEKSGIDYAEVCKIMGIMFVNASEKFMDELHREEIKKGRAKRITPTFR